MDTDPALVARIVQDHNDTLEGMFAFVKGERELTVSYIKELHASLLQHQDTVTAMDQFGKLLEKKLERGCYKKHHNPTRPDSSIHEYCPPEQVDSEMDRMIELHRRHVEGIVPSVVEAAWLHHVFTQIHPFEDGNGRVARAIATLVFLKAKAFPLVVTRDDRVKYIDALEIADTGDLKPLVALFTEIQKRALLRAIELTSQTRPARTVDEAVRAARDLLIAKGQIAPKEWNHAKDTARYLVNVALRRFNELATTLHNEIASVKHEYGFSVGVGQDDISALHDVAGQLHYVANPKEYHQFVKLTLRTERAAELILSFHGLGSQFRGLVAASVFLHVAECPPTPAAEDFFQINYKEDATRAEKRFAPWLEGAIVNGLTLWRQQL